MKSIRILLLSAAALICITSSAQEPATSKARDLSWLELQEFIDDNEHFFVNHYTDEYWGRQRNYSLLSGYLIVLANKFSHLFSMPVQSSNISLPYQGSK